MTECRRTGTAGPRADRGGESVVERGALNFEMSRADPQERVNSVNIRRARLRHPIVFDRDMDSSPGRLAEIVSEKIMLVSEGPIPAGALYNLRRESPQDVFGEGILDIPPHLFFIRR